MQNCTAVFSRGPQKGKQCGHKPQANGLLCSKHLAMAAANEQRSKTRQDAFKADEIFAKNNTFQAKPSRNSTYNITINSNTSYEKLSPDERRAFKDYITTLLTGRRITEYISDRMSPEDSTKNIVKIDTDLYFEIGEKNGFLHCHGYLRIEHNGFLSLRLNELRADMKKVFGKSLHVDSPVSSSADAVWAQYISKNATATKV